MDPCANAFRVPAKDVCGPVFFIIYFFSVEYWRALLYVYRNFPPTDSEQNYSLTWILHLLTENLRFPFFPVRVSFPLARACTTSFGSHFFRDHVFFGFFKPLYTHWVSHEKKIKKNKIKIWSTSFHLIKPSVLSFYWNRAHALPCERPFLTYSGHGLYRMGPLLLRLYPVCKSPWRRREGATWKQESLELGPLPCASPLFSYSPTPPRALLYM